MLRKQCPFPVRYGPGDEALGGDDHHLLATCIEWFDVG